jgi:hypothetical protein
VVRVHIGADAKDFTKLASTKDMRPINIKLTRTEENAKQIHKDI